MVPNTSELLPEPETPVKTVSRRFGSSTLTSLRLFTRAPCTRIRSWRSSSWSAGDAAFLALVIGSPPVVRSSPHDAGCSGLRDADQVARGGLEVVGPDDVDVLTSCASLRSDREARRTGGDTVEFSSFDQRGYRTVPARE